MRKRPYLTAGMCEAVLRSPLESIEQIDGRRRFWGWTQLPDEQKPRILRVVTLSDGQTIHNAFLDRDFRHGDESI